ncbi:hypothetical protein Tco_0791016 [Tanacetum coccineum]
MVVRVNDASESSKPSWGNAWEADLEKLRQKGVYEKRLKNCCMSWGKLIQLMHTTMVPEQVKTMKIQAGVQVSRLEDKDVIFRHEALGCHLLVVFVLDRTLLRDVAVYYHFAISTFPVKIVIRSSAFILEYLLQLPIRPEWQRFVTLVKQREELKTVSYHKRYAILKQHQNEVNEIRAEKLARTANPLALVTQQQPVYHPQNNPINYNQSSSTRLQAATRNRGKEKEIDKLLALISMSFKKIYKLTNNNLNTSSNTRNTNVDNAPRSNRGTRYDRQTGQYDNQREVNVVGAKGKCRYSDDEPGDQELEAHYMYMAHIQEVILDVVVNSGPIFDAESLQKVHNSDDDYNVFANERQHPKQPESINDAYLVEQSS